MRILLLFILFISLNLLCDVFELNLSGSMEESIKGAPIYIRTEIRNISGKKQKVVGRFTYDYILERSDGKLIKKKPEEQYKISPCEMVEIREIEHEMKEVKVVDILGLYDIEEAGIYLLKVIVSSRCDRGKGRDGRIEYDVWHGKLRQEIRLVIKEPEGEDKEAYNYFKGRIPLTGEGAKELLEKFPTSTYAGWAIKNIPTAKWAFRKEKHIQDYRWKRDLMENFIKVHRDFHFSGYLAAEAGNISLILGEEKKACDFFKESLELPWNVPGMNEQEINQHKEKIKTNLKELKDNSKCK